MSSDHPAADGPTLLAPAGPVEPVPVPPPVVAVVVTHDPGPWFEETLRSLTSSDYPSLAIFVLDAGSTEDPTARVAAVAPRAYVRRLTDNVGFAAAANEALRSVEGATFLLLCHDDVAIEPDAIRLMVEEAYRSNAGIVGPKLVAYDQPDVLLEVGLLVDRFAVPFSGVEPGELDQEQHDTVRDVFYVSSATMLVRSDLFQELGGFDPATWPDGEDLDLCWRALLAGARVMVAPDARVRHRRTLGSRAERDDRDAAAARRRARHRVRSLLKSYSALTLAWLVPLGFLFAVAEAFVHLLAGRPRHARAVLGAWLWNFRHLPDVLRARREVQALRTVPDSGLRSLQMRGSAQIRRLMTGHGATEDRIRSIGETGRSVVDAARSGIRQPLSVGVLVFLLAVVVGSRSFITKRVPAVGSFLPWPGVGGLLRAYGSGWRSVGLGSADPASPALAAMAGLGSLLLGATSFARTLLVVVSIPIGAWGAARLARRFTGTPVATFAAAAAYAVNPIARNDLAGGRLGPLVLYALAPFVVSSMIGLAVDARDRRATVRAFIGLTVLVAIVTAFFPLALLFPVLVAAAFLVASPLVGGVRVGVRAAGAALLACVAAIVLLVPWSLSQLATTDGSAWGLVWRPDVGLSDVLRFHTGPAGAGYSGWGLLAAASLALVVATGERLTWAARAWVLALFGFAAVWIPARFAPGTAVAVPEAGLVLAAVGLSLAVGIAIGAISHDLRTFHFGWRQLASVVGAVGLALPVLGFIADTGDGAWHAPSNDWAQTLSWTAAQSPGGSRLLIVGDPRALPGDPFVARGIGYVSFDNAVLDARSLWPSKPGASGLIGDELDLAARDRTTRAGHLLAPMGVRYVALVNGRDPDDGSVPAPAGLHDALDAQLDLRRLRTEGHYALYENTAWMPVRANVAAPVSSLRSRDAVTAGLTADLSRAAPLRTGTRATPGSALLSEAYDAHWQAHAGGRTLPHARTFGWANGWQLDRPATVKLRFTGQLTRNLMLLVQAILWLGLAVAWWLTRRRAPKGSRGRAAAEEPTVHETPEPVPT
jgi:GT2 family glycosyltransferase